MITNDKIYCSCALKPLDQGAMNVIKTCQKNLDLGPTKRLQESCECFKNAGLQLKCNTTTSK